MNYQTAGKMNFSRMIVGNQKIIHKITFIYADNPVDREDLFQEICLQIWKSHSSFNKAAQFSTWVYRIALNTAINYIRSKKRRIKPETLKFDYPIQEEDSFEQEQMEKMFGAISKLNRIDKAIILLWLEEKSYEEIGSIIGISKTNVSVKLVRIKKRLSEMINGKE